LAAERIRARRPQEGAVLTTQQIIGIVLILAAVIDVIVGLVIIGPRITNADSRRVVTLALIAGSGILAAIGIALLLGALQASQSAS
jgi:hypothetical protein